jgi:hypothetical protein
VSAGIGSLIMIARAWRQHAEDADEINWFEAEKDTPPAHAQSQLTFAWRAGNPARSRL